MTIKEVKKILADPSKQDLVTNIKKVTLDKCGKPHYSKELTVGELNKLFNDPKQRNVNLTIQISNKKTK